MFNKRPPWILAVSWGVLSALALTLFYVLVLRFSSGSWVHVVFEMRRMWYWVALLSVGFGVQISLAISLHRQATNRTAATVTSAVSTSTSAGAMLACCAHHLADVLPLLGLSGLAVFLARFQVPLIIFSLLVNLCGIIYLGRKLYNCRHT